MYKPIFVDSDDCGTDIAVGCGYQIDRRDPERHSRQIELICEMFAFPRITVFDRGPGTFRFDVDGITYYVSGAYAGGDWYFSLSRSPTGFDVINLNEVPQSVSDLWPLFTLSEYDQNGASIPVEFIQLCAAEAIGKLSGIGLTRETLRVPFIHRMPNGWTLREEAEIDGRKLRLRDATPLLQWKDAGRMTGVLASFV